MTQFREPAWMTEMINEARAISDRTDAEYRDKRKLGRRWKGMMTAGRSSQVKMRLRAASVPSTDWTGWQVDEFGNHFKTIGDNR